VSSEDQLYGNAAAAADDENGDGGGGARKVNVLGLNERLELVTDEFSAEAHLQSALQEWSRTSEGLRAWYGQHGLYREVDGALEPAQLAEALESELNDVAKTEERAAEAAADALMTAEEEAAVVFDVVEGDLAEQDEAEAAVESELARDVADAEAAEAARIAAEKAEEAALLASGKKKPKSATKKPKSAKKGTPSHHHHHTHTHTRTHSHTHTHTHTHPCTHTHTHTRRR
jgi:hypothetical protein